LDAKHLLDPVMPQYQHGRSRTWLTVKNPDSPGKPHPRGEAAPDGDW